MIKASFVYIVWFNGYIMWTERVIGEELISSKEVEMRALVALSGAKVLGCRRVRVSCDAMEAIQTIKGSKCWVLISMVADIFSIVDFDKIYFCHIPIRLHEMAHQMAKLYQSFNCEVEWSIYYLDWLVESVPWCDVWCGCMCVHFFSLAH